MYEKIKLQQLIRLKDADVNFIQKIIDEEMENNMGRSKYKEPMLLVKQKYFSNMGCDACPYKGKIFSLLKIGDNALARLCPECKKRLKRSLRKDAKNTRRIKK